MDTKALINQQERQFAEAVDIIAQHRSHASRVVNEDTLLTAWQVSPYVSGKLKSAEWGSKVVTKLSEYIRSQRPDFKKGIAEEIYNMVMFFEEYSSESFSATVTCYLNSEFVQLPAGQLENISSVKTETETIVQMPSAQFVPMATGQMPNILNVASKSISSTM